MYLRCNRRFKDGQEPCYWDIVESKRCADGRGVQRQVGYLGEINDRQHEAWCRVIEVLDEDPRRRTPLALFPVERELPEYAQAYSVQVRRDARPLHRPRPWGAGWLASRLYEQLGLDHFWPASREGTRWRPIRQTLGVYRWLDPGSEGRLHRSGLEQSAMADRRGADSARVEKDALQRGLDQLRPHQRALFHHWTERWPDRFGVRFDLLLYDLTSPYFESPPPQDEKDQRRLGSSRDQRRDCVPVVRAWIVTPAGFPIAYEVLAGHTADQTPLKRFGPKVEMPSGKADRIGGMDRGLPTEDVLEDMRTADPPVYYRVGTPRGRLTQLARDLLPWPWQAVRAGVSGKGLPPDGELDGFAESRDRLHQERALRQRQLQGRVKRWKQRQPMKFNDTRRLRLQLGEAKGRQRAAQRLIEVVWPKPAASKTPPQPATAGATNPLTFAFRLDRPKLRPVRRREGRYLLRTHRWGRDPEDLWPFYLQLTEVEAVFKNLQDDLPLRPLYPQLERRIEAPIFLAFLAYCRPITWRAPLKPLAPGLTSRAVLDQLARIQMLDVHLPITDGRTLILSRYTEPNPDQRLLLERLGLTLPPQPPPRITAAGQLVH